MQILIRNTVIQKAEDGYRKIIKGKIGAFSRENNKFPVITNFIRILFFLEALTLNYIFQVFTTE